MDIALKQRLVGASVLIALAVVVLPMLLGGRPEEGEQEAQTIELPPQPSELDFETRRFPVGEAPPTAQRKLEDSSLSASSGDLQLPQPDSDLPAEPASSPGTVAHVELEARAFQDELREEVESAESAPNDTQTQDSAESVEGQVRSEQAATSPAKAVVPSATQASGGRYIVQVASFGSIANANRLAGTLRGSGYAVMSDTVSADVGTLHRVRVGPFANEAEANTAVSQIRKQVPDVKPRVVDLRPEQSAQVTTPSDPLVRWVVQLGSFSSTGNADRLVERVRAEGLSAYKEAVSSGGSTIYRVRVGPFLERDEAIRVDGLIAARLSVDGVVMSAD